MKGVTDANGLGVLSYASTAAADYANAYIYLDPSGALCKDTFTNLAPPHVMLSTKDAEVRPSSLSCTNLAMVVAGLGFLRS